MAGGIGTTTMLSVFYALLLFGQLVEMRPQNPNGQQLNVKRNVGQTEVTAGNKLIRKDFFILEIPKEVIEDEIQDQMDLMKEKRQQQQAIELDRFIVKLFVEFQKREREGTLDKNLVDPQRLS